MEHICNLNDSGYCDDPDRDWCPIEEKCTVWNGEFCTCGYEWGTM